MKRLWRWLLCKLGRHNDAGTLKVSVAGVLTVIPRCSCGRVHADRIREAAWSRRHRRRFERAVLPRAVRRLR